MKIFKFKDSHGVVAYVKVDDEHAHILRSQVWHVRTEKGNICLRRMVNGCEEYFNRRVYGEVPEGKRICHKNGDALDFRRQNLFLMDASELLTLARLVRGDSSAIQHPGHFACGHKKDGNTNPSGQCKVCNDVAVKKYREKKKRNLTVSAETSAD